jgi:hypothetical protein
MFCGLMLGYMSSHQCLTRCPDRSNDVVRSTFKGIMLTREAPTTSAATSHAQDEGVMGNILSAATHGTVGP